NMHWGHAVSDDLVEWEELPVALAPEKPYEDGNGCMSGSAIEAEGKLWLFYNSMSSTGGETVSAACSEDGIRFTKLETNPILRPPFEGSNIKLRDPIVFRYGGSYRMAVGAGAAGIAKVLLYESRDLVSWEYVGELLSDSRYGSVIESPGLFELDGRWVFIIQSEKHLPTKVLFASGEFDGKRFIFDDEFDPFFPIETGSDFYNPVTFEDRDGRRILISWLYSTKLAGSSVLSAPRELYFDLADRLVMQPAEVLRDFAITDSRFVMYEEGRLCVRFEGKTLFSKAYASEPEYSVLEDVGTVELFIDGGHENISMFIC
ncbi:MAG: glycoside hydrolase family 32 protein, partial [Ruminococcaceae bacterium]|nr:glycoside hydrolase family 32 protein [Oscillospiraceae bacterium]